MRFHWQNLNDSEIHPRRGGGLRHGRAWWTFFESREPRNGEEEKRIKYRPGWTVHPTWCLFWSGSCGISVQFNRREDHGVTLHLAVPWLFQVFLTLSGGPFAWLADRVLPKLAKDQRPRYPGEELPIRDYGDRELFNVYWHSGGLWWFFWRDPMGGWSSRSPWWRRKLLEGHFDPVDFLFGRTEYAARPLVGPVSVLIPMPERAYQATVTIEECTWRRPRWPFVWRRWVSHEVDCKQDPVPFPGKGENSWDCGEDAIYGSHGPNKSGTLEEAIASVVESVMNSRRRHGGSVTWVPKEDHRPKECPTPPAPPTARA